MGKFWIDGNFWIDPIVDYNIEGKFGRAGMQSSGMYEPHINIVRSNN
jgi:hypothetical protein